MKSYYYHGSTRVAVHDGNGTGTTGLSWLFADHLGSTSLTTNDSGTKTAEVRYKAWGEDRYTSGTIPTTMKYMGQREESLLGLYFYNARWYDPVLGRFIQADTLVPEPGNPLAWDRYAYVLNNPVSFLDPSGHKPCDEILWNGQCIRFDKIIPPPELPKVPDAPSDGDLATPWDVGIEWLMGEGPRRHEFREGDPFTELLQEHDYLEYLKAITGEKLKAGDFSLGYYKYDLSGIEGILKYIKDYSTLITLGETGNLAVTYLGGYIVEVYITDVNFSTGDAEVTFHVWNSSTLGSGIRPPVIGYKGFWNNIVSPLINPSKGRMSKVEQSFWWSETISFKK